MIREFITIATVSDDYDSKNSRREELIRCKDCKFTDGEKPINDGRYWCILHSAFMYYCSDAERKEE